MRNANLDLTQTGSVVAVIDEHNCIGCRRCIDACPVDAILGAARQMHSVIASECTGCQLCLPPCPVDCITMQPCVGEHTDLASRIQTAQRRHRARQKRLRREQAEQAARLRAKKIARKHSDGENDPRKALIAAAIARVQKRKAQKKPPRVNLDGNE